MSEIICFEMLRKYCKLLYESSVARNFNATAGLTFAVIAVYIICTLVGYFWLEEINYFFKIS